MCYNYRIENRANEEPAAILFTSATRKKKEAFRLPRSGCLGTPLTLPQSLYGRMDGRTGGWTYADVRTKIFRMNGLPNLLTHGAPRAASSAINLDYKQSLFPLRDSRGKRTSERAQNRVPR